MIDYREIIRLKSLKFSNVAIANSLCCSRNTVSEVLKLAGSHSLEWPVPDTLTNNDIEHLFYPDRGTNEGRRLPDYEYVYNELAKPGVTLSLLWAEYCAKCEAEHTIPYQHTQFVSAKYSCGFSNTLISSIIVGERYLDYFTTITEDRLWQLLAKPVFRWRNRSGLSMNAAKAV